MSRAPQLNSIVLIDDNPATNLIHKKIISRENCAHEIHEFNYAESALKFLKKFEDGIEPKDQCPELIFLDINIPGLNGWEFIDEYKTSIENQNSVIVMLTTSINPDDEIKARSNEIISDFLQKPLTAEKLRSVVDQHVAPSLNEVVVEEQH